MVLGYLIFTSLWGSGNAGFFITAEPQSSHPSFRDVQWGPRETCWSGGGPAGIQSGSSLHRNSVYMYVIMYICTCVLYIQLNVVRIHVRAHACMYCQFMSLIKACLAACPELGQ